MKMDCSDLLSPYHLGLRIGSFEDLFHHSRMRYLVELQRQRKLYLPYLFLQIAPFLNYGMGSGFVMHRLMDEGLAEIKDGLFVVNEDEINRRSKI